MKRPGFRTTGLCCALALVLGAGFAPRPAAADDSLIPGGVTLKIEWPSGLSGNLLKTEASVPVNTTSLSALAAQSADPVKMGFTYSTLDDNIDWTGRIAPMDGSTSRRTNSDIVLLNATLYGKQDTALREGELAPFLGAGVGLSRSTRTRVMDDDPLGGTPVTLSDSDADIRPAARVGFGFSTQLSPSLTLTTTADAYWLGNSGSLGSVAGDGDSMGDDGLSLTVMTGLHYAF